MRKWQTQITLKSKHNVIETITRANETLFQIVQMKTQYQLYYITKQSQNEEQRCLTIGEGLKVGTKTPFG